MQQKISVLIAEDERFISHALKEIIRRNFACDRLDIANDGAEAMGFLKSYSYDIAILDWNMPNKTGDEVLVDIRSASKTSSMPVIMLTARSDKDSVITAVQAGATDYIAKPFKQGDILQRIKRLLS